MLCQFHVLQLEKMPWRCTIHERLSVIAKVINFGLLLKSYCLLWKLCTILPSRSRPIVSFFHNLPPVIIKTGQLCTLVFKLRVNSSKIFPESPLRILTADLHACQCSSSTKIEDQIVSDRR
jgi:hypothetical protein